MPAAVAVTDATFEQEVLRSPVPVLVDFWGPGCSACRLVAPLVEEAAATYAGRLKVVTVDAHANQASAARFGVRGIPNLVLVKNGEVAEQLLGAVAKAKLVRSIEAVLDA
jgi:thioredoxin 1